MSGQRRQRRLVIIAKEREFDEEQWKQLLTAFAYVLHERRKAREEAHAAENGTADKAATPEAGDDH